MAKIKSFKKIATVFSLSLLLASCSEVVARPKSYDNPLIDGLTQEVNNSLSKLFDSYRDGSTSKSDVLDAVLLAIAENEFGEYEKASATFKETVYARGLDKLYTEVSSGTYEYRSIFNEKQFVVKSIYAQNYHISDGENDLTNVGDIAGLDDHFFNEGVFLPSIDESNFHLPENKLIHIEYYTPYIEDKFVPEIYRELLVEKFIKEEQAQTIGRNYGRKVKYIAIPDSTRYPEAASRLLNAYIDQNILGTGDDDLEILANAWRGVTGDYIGNEAALITAAGIEGQTLYGAVVEDYSKIKDDEKLTDKEIENQFTGNNTYPKEVGLQIKTNEVRQTELITSDWTIKNGGLTSLPSTIRERVFNIGTANGVDLVKDDKGIVADAGIIEGTQTANTFVRNIKGNFYLVPKQYEKNDNRNFLIYENSTSYIIQIEEAVNTAKLTEGNAREYSKLGRTEAEIASIVDNVTRKLAEVEANRATSIQFYLEKLDVVFHDKSVKDYFVEQFPEIFS